MITYIVGRLQWNLVLIPFDLTSLNVVCYVQAACMCLYFPNQNSRVDMEDLKIRHDRVR